MKKIHVSDAVGRVLCHDMTAITEDGFKGVRFKRGHEIREEDIPAFLDMGKNYIFVWDPSVNEVHKEDAAIKLSEVIGDDSVLLSGPSEGKITVSAAFDGLVRIDREGLKAINSLPDYTVATVPDKLKVKRGDRLAGVRIVPLVTAEENVKNAVELALKYKPVITVKPFHDLKCGLIITGTEIYEGRIKDKFEPIIRGKLEEYNSTLLGVVKCPDDIEMIRRAKNYFLEEKADIILFTGGMSVDPDDLTPGAIKEDGAELICQGVPMQPGNMLTIAYLGDTLLVGIPGASMHAKVTSLDVFLPRFFAKEKITREEIADLGLGGLCVNCKECTYPVCYFGRGN